jgi:hypothetical protein
MMSDASGCPFTRYPCEKLGGDKRSEAVEPWFWKNGDAEDLVISMTEFHL